MLFTTGFLDTYCNVKFHKAISLSKQEAARKEKIMRKLITSGLLAGLTVLGFAATVTVPLYKVAQTNHGASIGTVTLKDTRYGLLIKPRLHDLSPGLHGFHVHQKPNCSDNGLAAGGHLDPTHTNKHLGPYNPSGHLGDLPALYVNQQGIASTPMLAPRVTVTQLFGHSLMVHAGGDNYSDLPKPLGGGGKRIACGVVK